MCACVHVLACVHVCMCACVHVLVHLIVIVIVEGGVHEGIELHCGVHVGPRGWGAYF
jgi:hypothetical protein